MAQGDVANAKDDTRFYSEDGGSGLADLATDLSHQADDLVVGTNCVYEAGAQSRWDTGSPAAWELDVDLDTGDTGYLYAYEAGGNGVRIELAVGRVITAYVDNAQVCSVTVPGIGITRENVIVSWSMEGNMLTTGASDEIRSELRAYNVTDGTYVQDVATHAEVTSANTTALWGASTSAGANVFSGTMNRLRFSVGRFHPASELYQDFVSMTEVPTLTLESRREVPVPSRDAGAGAHDLFTGPVYQSVAAGLLQADLRQAGAVVSELYVDVVDHDESPPANRALDDPDGDGFTFLVQYLRLRPVPRTCNRLLVRVHVQAWRTDANPADDVVVRCYSMSRPPTGLQNVPGPEAPWLRFYRTVTRTSNDGSGTTGGAWLTFDHIELARTPGGDGTWLCLAFDVQDAGGAGATAAQRWRVRAWEVEPGVEAIAGEFPLGGLG